MARTTRSAKLAPNPPVGHLTGSRVAQGGKVIIDMFVHRKDDCMTGPTKRVRNVYDYLNPDPDLIPSAHAWTSSQ